MSALEEKKTTPMMEQWHQCKLAAKEALLLFRMGDFYEAFYEDAKILAEELELTLTSRQGIPMSGVPWHTCETYIDKLVAKGYRIAIAEQTEDPKKAKGLVKREIVRLITPGTVVSSSLIHEKSNNFIVSLTQVGAIFGLAACDITTATFRVAEFESIEELFNELYRLSPSEIATSSKFKGKHSSLFREFSKTPFSEIDAWQYDHQTAYRRLSEHFQVSNLDGFGLKGMVAAINAAGALFAYMQDDLSVAVQHIRSITPYTTKETLLLDHTCQRTLELDLLLNVIDHTQTPMGGRLLREWLKQPLVCLHAIEQRQKSVKELLSNYMVLSSIRKELKSVRDLERVMMRISSGFATPKDLLTLRVSLEQVPKIKRHISCFETELLSLADKQLIDMTQLVECLKMALVEEPPVRMTDGNIFREGFHADLDELKQFAKGGKEWLGIYQGKLKAATGIKNLKVSFNKIFGYYIEVSKGQAHLMPESFQRRQTLVNSERFISPELKEYEGKILSAEERIQTLEQSLFLELKEKVLAYEYHIFKMAQAIAHIDVLTSLAEAAKRYDFSCPVVNESSSLSIRGGRHPIVELNTGKETFIPNETSLNCSNERLMLITGPNMAGKSTYIRQVALIVILAQMGSFVPAKEACIGIVDRIFTRIGANDDLSKGQSTFMVEMSETANILHHATPRSLVILDEIGRGTSTYDGVSIAWAVAEFLLEKRAKTLFATHYWELTELEKTMNGAINYHASVKENQDGIIFLHKIERGGADKSYGIHVAKLAGLPLSVIDRAGAILKRLESRKEKSKPSKIEKTEKQLTFF